MDNGQRGLVIITAPAAAVMDQQRALVVGLELHDMTMREIVLANVWLARKIECFGTGAKVDQEVSASAARMSHQDSAIWSAVAVDIEHRLIAISLRRRLFGACAGRSHCDSGGKLYCRRRKCWLHDEPPD